MHLLKFSTKCIKLIAILYNNDLQEYYVMPLEYKYYTEGAKLIKNFKPNVRHEEIIPSKYAKTISFYLKTKYKLIMSSNEVLDYLNKHGISTISEFKEIVSKI